MRHIIVNMVTVKIEDLSNEGAGIGRLPSGKCCFVEGALPGETVEAAIVKDSPKFAECILENVITPSDQRVRPYGAPKIPGAALAHLSYGGQIAYKHKKVRDCLIRLGKIGAEDVDRVLSPVIPSAETTLYRNHMQYKIEGSIIGQTGSDGVSIIPYEEDFLEYPVFGKIVKAVEACLDRCPTKLLTGLVLRGSLRTGEVLAEFITCDTRSHETVIRQMQDLIKSAGIIEAIRDAAEGYELRGVLFRISPDRISGRTRSGKRFVLEGESFYEEEFCSQRFIVEAGSFFQVNIPQAEAIVNIIREYVSGSKTLVDLYCGAGTLGLSVMDEGTRLLGIETSQEAVNSAVRNAKSAYQEDQDRIKFIKKDAAKTDLAGMIRSGQIPAPDAVIVDPPRKGLGEPVIAQIKMLGAPKLVYVSCDPATLARDLKMLRSDYTIDKVQPVDMFPMTYHIENVVLMSKR